MGFQGQHVPEALDLLPGTSNYLIGTDPSTWRTNIRAYARVRTRGIYPGIDLTYYSTDGKLEYDFLVHPGADPHCIEVALNGAEAARVDEAGDLIVSLPTGELRWRKPHAYQEEKGARRPVEARFVLSTPARLRFHLGRYDPALPLVIDPVLAYATFLGGAQADQADAVAADSTGNIYVAGLTSSADFPAQDAFQPSRASRGSDAFVAKLNAQGNALVYCTYLGGGDEDRAAGVAVDAAGNAYVSGTTRSSDFPRKNPLQSRPGGSTDVFLAKFNAAGSLLFSTTLGGGGSDSVAALALDAAGNSYLTGTTYSSDFPVRNALQAAYGGDGDAFITKVNAAGTALVYSTYLGGGKRMGVPPATDRANAIAVDTSGNAYITGEAFSSDFPTANAMIGDRNQYSMAEAFVLKLNAAGSAATYSTFLAHASWSAGSKIAVDASGSVYVSGASASSASWSCGMLGDCGVSTSGRSVWLRKLNPQGAEVFTRPADYQRGLVVDGAGNLHGIGAAGSVFKLNSAGDLLADLRISTAECWAIAVDASGNAVIAGVTASAGFPVKDGLQPEYAGGGDAFVARISWTGGSTDCSLSCSARAPLGLAIVGEEGEYSSSAVVSSCRVGASVEWDFGDQTPRRSTAVATHAYTAPGSYTWTLTANASGAQPCRRTGQIEVISRPSVTGGVVNAASYAGGGVAPGELLTIFGGALGPAALTKAGLTPDGQHFPTTLAGVRVLFDEQPAPLIYVSSSQISAIAPFSLAGKHSTQLSVEYRGIRSNTRSLRVDEAVPGVFTMDASGTGQGAILNQDGSFNLAANPATPGSVIVLYGTGAGQTKPPGEDGKITGGELPTPVLPVSVRIGGVPAEVVYAGAAPGMVAGVLQVNARIPPGVTSTATASHVQAYGELPLSFEPNQGQFDTAVRFGSRGAGYGLFLTGSAAVMVFPGRGARAGGTRAPVVLRMTLPGATPSSEWEGIDRLPGISNYFVGAVPATWRTNIPNFARVRVKQVYPGVDLVYYGTRGRLEYDFTVQPGADPGQIEIAFEGAGHARLDEHGDLLLHTAAGEVRWGRPSVYQESDGRRLPVAAAYALKNGRRVGFKLARYRPDLPLVIDPVLAYSLALGGHADAGMGVAVDASGNAYVVGRASNYDRFLTVNPLPNVAGPGFVVKLNPTGNAVLYSTFLGAAVANGIAIDGQGNAYVTGETYGNGNSFPLVRPLRACAGREDRPKPEAFVLKLGSAGNELIYSTCLGGSEYDVGNGIAVDPAGNAYVAGRTVSRDFPIANALQPDYRARNDQTTRSGTAFLAKLNSSGSALVYSTYLSASLMNRTYPGLAPRTDPDFGADATSVSADASGNAYVVGEASRYDPGDLSLDGFPRRISENEGFLVKLDPAGSRLLYTSELYLMKRATSVALDAEGNVYLSDNLAFVIKVSPQGPVRWSKRLPGGISGVTVPYGIAVDRAGNVYVAGNTSSKDFPVVNPVQSAYGGTSGADSYHQGDGFVVKLDSSGSAFLYSTFLGGGDPDAAHAIAVDGDGNAYVTGYTYSQNFPNTTSMGGSGAWVAKISSAETKGGPVYVELFVGSAASKPVTVQIDGSR